MPKAATLLAVLLSPVHNEGATELPRRAGAGAAAALLTLKVPRRDDDLVIAWAGCREKASSLALRRRVASILAMLLAGTMADVSGCVCALNFVWCVLVLRCVCGSRARETRKERMEDGVLLQQERQ